MIFPTLKKLSLLKLPNLVDWKDAMELTTIEMMFPCLVELRIEICGQLTSAPCHFLSLKKLDVTNIKCMAFERIISKLSTLASLKINDITELVCLPEQLFQNNRSLMSIKISCCFDLVSISPHQDVTFPSLEMFEVFNCPNLRSFLILQGAGSCL